LTKPYNVRVGWLAGMHDKVHRKCQKIVVHTEVRHRIGKLMAKQKPVGESIIGHRLHYDEDTAVSVIKLQSK
jgi:hypothetical protein